MGRADHHAIHTVFVEKLSGPVSVPRGEAGVIVTERGTADLRGCSLRERERRLRAISGSS